MEFLPIDSLDAGLAVVLLGFATTFFTQAAKYLKMDGKTMAAIFSVVFAVGFFFYQNILTIENKNAIAIFITSVYGIATAMYNFAAKFILPKVK